MSASCEQSMTTWISVFICASEDLDFVNHHEWPRLMINHLGDNCKIRNSRQETYVVEGSTAAEPIKHYYEYDEVRRAVSVN